MCFAALVYLSKVIEWSLARAIMAIRCSLLMVVDRQWEKKSVQCGKSSREMCDGCGHGSIAMDQTVLLHKAERGHSCAARA